MKVRILDILTWSLISVVFAGLFNLEGDRPTAIVFLVLSIVGLILAFGKLCKE